MRLLILFAGLLTMTATLPAADLEYVKTRRSDHVDTHHGTKVPDPYRWLEDDVRKSKDVAGWVKAQNKVTFEYLKKLPQREIIRKRIETLWNYEKFGTPFKKGGRYYFYKNDGLQNQSVLHSLDSLESEPEILIDPNTWSKDGTVALAGT